MDDVQADTSFCSLLVGGQTTEISTGAKSPDNLSALSGTTKLAIPNGDTQSQIITLPQVIYGLPNGTCDTFDVMSGALTQRVSKLVLNGGSSKSWAVGVSGWKTDGDTIAFYIYLTDELINGTSICDRFVTAQNNINTDTESWMLRYLTFSAIRALKSRLIGWSDSWTQTQKVTAFKNWLAQNPVTILYELNRPVYTVLTPQQVSTYYPSSNLALDSGTITVKYNRDSNQVLKKLENTINALGKSV